MFTLFRRIRQKLIDSGSVLKYLLYAIGEILLVVIGILIALQVNNWNEERIEKQKVNTYLIQVQNELLNDLKESVNVIEYLERKDELLEKVLKEQVSEEDYRTNRNLRFLTGNWISFNLNMDGFENLMSIIDESSFENRELLNQLKGLYVDMAEEIRRINERYRDYTFETNILIFQNFGWSKNYDVLTGQAISPEELQYKLNSPLYLSSVVMYRGLGIGNFRSDLYQAQVNMANLYKSIAEVTNFEPDHEIVNGYYNSPPESVYQSFIGIYSQDDNDLQFRIFEERDSLKLQYLNETGDVFHLVEGSGNRFQLNDNSTQFVALNDSTLLQMNMSRTRWRKSN